MVTITNDNSAPRLPVSVEIVIVRVVSLSTTEIPAMTRLKIRSSGSGYFKVLKLTLYHTVPNTNNFFKIYMNTLYKNTKYIIQYIYIYKATFSPCPKTFFAPDFNLSFADILAANDKFFSCDKGSTLYKTILRINDHRDVEI